MMQAGWDERLPILEVAADCIVSKMGDVTIALEVEKPEIFTLSAGEYGALHQAFVKGLKVLPAGTVFHMQDTYRRDRYRARFMDSAGFLARAGERFFDGRPYLRHSSRIYLTMRPAGRRAVTSATSALLRGTLVPAGTLDGQAAQALEDAVRQLVRIVEDSRLVKLRRIKTSELVSTARAAGLIERYCWLLDEGQAPMVRDIDWRGTMQVGSQECVVYTLADAADLPGSCSASVSYDKYSSEQAKLPVGYMAGLGLLWPYDHICNTYLIMQDQPAVMKKLEAKRLRLQSLSKMSRENAVGMEAVNNYLNEAVGEQRVSVKLHVNVLAWTDDPGGVKELRSRMSAAMAGMDAVAHEETVGAPQIWYAGIPGNAGELPENECVDTFLEQGCCFLPFETNYRSSSSSFSLRLGDRLTGRPVNVDIDIEARQLGLTQNGNFFVLSGSGGGKSFLMNHICRTYYDLGMHILIVDVGHSYETLCRLVGGVYLTYEASVPIRFNPFYIPTGKAPDWEKKESIKSLLLALWKQSDEEHFRSEYVAISDAVGAYYDWLRERPEVFPCFDSFYGFMAEEYVGVLRSEGVSVKIFDVENFLYVLRPYYKGGEYDFLLNATENLDLLSARFIVFELDNIKEIPTLFVVVTLVIVQVFMAKVRHLRGIWKTILIEEAWKAIANAGMAENIRGWVKTLRKHMGKLGLVSQELDDIIDSPIIKQAVINSSDCKMLLDQSKFANRFEDIQKLLGLTEKQRAEILSINKGHDAGRMYKDVWIGLGAGHSRVYRLETSLEEYLAYTSDQGEKVKIEEYARRYGSWERGIEVLAGEMRKNSSN